MDYSLGDPVLSVTTGLLKYPLLKPGACPALLVAHLGYAHSNEYAGSCADGGGLKFPIPLG